MRREHKIDLDLQLADKKLSDDIYLNKKKIKFRNKNIKIK